MMFQRMTSMKMIQKLKILLLKVSYICARFFHSLICMIHLVDDPIEAIEDQSLVLSKYARAKLKKGEKLCIGDTVEFRHSVGDSKFSTSLLD